MLSVLFALLVVTSCDVLAPGSTIEDPEAGLVSDLVPNGYETARLTVGDQYYVDREHTITALGPGLADRLWIRTAYDDKDATGESFISFTLLEDAVVAVGYDNRATTTPDWLDGWVQSSTEIAVSEAAASPLTVLHKAYGPGSVVLGGNQAVGADGAVSMYTVMILRPSELEPVAVTISPSSVILDVGDSAQFTATVTDALQRPIAVGTIEWSATGGTITAEGIYTAGATPGSYEVTATDSERGLNESVPVSLRDPNEEDTTPPVMSNGLPDGELPAGTSETTMSVATNEPATCKWGTSSSASYEDMPNTFTTTGGTAHSTTLTGLEDGLSYRQYVRCQDDAGNSNTSSKVIGFSVATGADTTPPVISNGQPSGQLPAGTTETTMSVATDESATCKWGTSSSASFEDMPNTFTTTGGTTHSTTLTGLMDGQSYTRYVRCQDDAGNTNTSSYTINFTIAGVGGSTQITGITFDASSLNIFDNNTDLWPIAWAGDDKLYTAGGDGDGWDGVDTRGLNVTVLDADLTPDGDLQNKGTEVFSKGGVLPTGIIALPGGELFIIEEERNGGFDQIRIGKSVDGGVTWTYNGDPDDDWDYAEPDGAFAHSSFVNHGMDDAGAPGDYVYVVGGNPVTAASEFMADQVDLFRVPRNAVQDRSQHEYFAGFDGNGDPTWTSEISQKVGILTRPGEVHWAVRMTWNPVVDRYLLCFFVDKSGTLAVYDGPAPWGPWTQIHEATLLDTTEKYNLSFVNKADWLSADGLTWWGVFSGEGTYDAFSVIKATLTTGQ